MMLRNIGTQLAVVGHLPFTPKFLAGKQRSPEAEEKAETQTVPGRRVDHRTVLPAAFHCLVCSHRRPLPQVFLLKINISTGLIT